MGDNVGAIWHCAFTSEIILYAVLSKGQLMYDPWGELNPEGFRESEDWGELTPFLTPWGDGVFLDVAGAAKEFYRRLESGGSSEEHVGLNAQEQGSEVGDDDLAFPGGELELELEDTGGLA